MQQAAWLLIRPGSSKTSLLTAISKHAYASHGACLSVSSATSSFSPGSDVIAQQTVPWLTVHNRAYSAAAAPTTGSGMATGAVAASAADTASTSAPAPPSSSPFMPRWLRNLFPGAYISSDTPCSIESATPHWSGQEVTPPDAVQAANICRRVQRWSGRRRVLVPAAAAAAARAQRRMISSSWRRCATWTCRVGRAAAGVGTGAFCKRRDAAMAVVVLTRCRVVRHGEVSGTFPRAL